MQISTQGGGGAEWQLSIRLLDSTPVDINPKTLTTLQYIWEDQVIALVRLWSAFYWTGHVRMWHTPTLACAPGTTTLKTRVGHRWKHFLRLSVHKKEFLTTNFVLCTTQFIHSRSPRVGLCLVVTSWKHELHLPRLETFHFLYWRWSIPNKEMISHSL